MQSYNLLSKLVFVWSPYIQVDTIGMKEELIDNLNSIAITVTKSMRLISQILKPGAHIPEDAVLKRSCSDSGEHVLLPGNANRCWEFMGQVSPRLKASWIAQRFIPELHKFGEWRVFFIGGKPIHVVHTRYNEDKSVWTWEQADSYYSLAEFKYG
jgi:glutathione synthase/RimK-type ligase-like ATP-grasp enzyme